MASYADGNDLISRYDVDTVGDLATDQRESSDPSSVPNLPNVLTALMDASGEIDVALTVGERYLPSQLEALTGNSQSKLKRITCDIAMSLLCSRRVGTDYLELAEKVAKISRDHLRSLSNGENVFGLQSLFDASVIDVGTISTCEIERRNLLPSRMTRFFPTDSQRMPLQ